MTQEDKQLLLVELSARLMYGLMCQVDDGAAGLNDGKLIEIDISKELVRFDADYYWDAWIDDVKPYLRPLSSMTKEEEKEYNSFIIGQQPFDSDFSAYPIEHKLLYEFDIKNYIDWLNAHHFDYRGLIEKGLAIEVTEENNPYKA
jgi:hypothetical protein